ncbi:Calx-beta domain-containing protein [Wenzhouxiangella marina]|uniref:Calx-beta domain-containing protein n=1 Tax=Wenzhouxiangella marina TaxID=1579979 RepID=UPI00146FFC69|nr:Calx-beta domain-containing protein [Wenzhouxiangella marina]MBB6087993.1 hypothetical protein [Wenzhouxiangella marina]
MSGLTPEVVALGPAGALPQNRRFAAAWIERVEQGGVTHEYVLAALVDGAGNVVTGPNRLGRYEFEQSVSNPSITVDERGFFTVIWSALEIVSNSDFTQDVYARTFSFNASATNQLCPSDGGGLQEPLVNPAALWSSEEVLPTTTGNAILQRPRLHIDADSAASGRTVILVADHRASPYWGLYALSTELFAGTPPADEVQRCEDPYAYLSRDPLTGYDVTTFVTGNAEAKVRGRVAINENNNRSVVVWRAQEGGIFGQRLTPSGQLEGGELTIVAPSANVQQSFHDPDVDYAVDGTFRVVWERHQYQIGGGNPAVSEILMSNFTEDGNATQEAVLVDQETAVNGRFIRSLRYPRVNASDLDGDFAVSYSRQQQTCPHDNENDFGNWFLSTSCAGDASDIVFGPNGGSCSLNLTYTNTSSTGSRCRARVNVVPFDEDTAFQGLQLSPDSPWAWDDFGSFVRAVTLQATPNDFSIEERCALITYSSPYSQRTRLVRQPCQNGSGIPCRSCEEQAQELGIVLPTDELPPETASVDRSDETTGLPPTNDVDVRLRWFEAGYERDSATPVPPVTVNSHPRSNGSTSLALSRSGEMMLAWMAVNVPVLDAEGVMVGVEAQPLVVQSLESPVELSINDVGILEGPLGRATANFTVSASKPYPYLPTDCADDGDPMTPLPSTPQPSVTLLTANDTATFQSGDYERTTRTLTFADQCDPEQEWQSQLAFSVPVTDDLVYEDTESFFVDMFDETNAIVVRRQGIGAIVDNDPPAVVQPPSEQVFICEDGSLPSTAGSPPGGPLVYSCDENAEATGFVEIPVELSVVQEVEGSVEFTTVNGVSFGTIGGAESGLQNDYEPVIGELQFLPGNDRAFLSIDLVDDGFAELQEQFFVELTGSTNLTLPEGATPEETLAARRITVNIIDNDTCSTPPQWVLADGDGTPGAAPPRLPQAGTEEERTGYFCVINDAVGGFGECPWATRLDIDPDDFDAIWLERKDIPFSPPEDYPSPPSQQEIDEGVAACAQVAGATGAIRYRAISDNLPTENNEQPASRSERIIFANGDPATVPRTIEQAGSGACSATITPAVISVLPVGGEVTLDVDFGGVPGCEFNQWTAEVIQGAPWLSIDEVSSGAGNGTVSVSIQPFVLDQTPVGGAEPPRRGRLTIASIQVPVEQEAPLFDHFDDGIPPSSSAWFYTEPSAWSEPLDGTQPGNGTHLIADTDSIARLIADPIFAGCSRCLLESSVRFDQFSKGRITIYLWWQGEDDHLRLTVDEFRDEWTLTQRVDGTDHELRRYLSDVQVGIEYAVRIEFRNEQSGPLILVDVSGQGMCTTPQAGPNVCLPYDADPDPDPIAVDYVIGSGTVGLEVEATRASFNLLRVIRADGETPVLHRLFNDRFEVPSN